MAILDFKEIPDAYHGTPARRTKKAAKKAGPPPANGAQVALSLSADLDAFEKFASEFFTHICGCKVIQAISRGQDGGRDLLIEGELTPEVKGRFLISCKHKASSGNSVNTDKDEPNAKGRLDASGAKFFIGFYSTIASSGLRRHLEDTRANHKDFDFLIFNSGDIESRLISVDEPRGWLLAARHFPKSMGNLFRRFVVPINYYKADDVKRMGSQLSLDGPYGGIRSMPPTAAATDKAKSEMADQANDDLTSDVHTVFFCDALTDFIRLLPHAFAHVPGADPTNLELREVTPNFAANRADLGDGHQTTLRIIAAVWSFWDAERSVDWLVDRTVDPADTETARTAQARYVASSLTIGKVSEVCNGKYRDILARLVAYCPTKISSVPFGALVERFGKRLDRERQLAADFKRIVAGLKDNQRAELARYDGHHADANGWLQLCAILGWEEVVAKLDEKVAEAMRQAPVSLGEFARPSHIGFNRTVYNQWLEESLGLAGPGTAGNAAGTGQI